MTYREGSQGLWLQFPNANSADQFDTCCDRILPAPVQAGTLRPTLEHLRDLGLVSAPRVVGEFYSSEREARDEAIARSWSFDDITSLAADDLSDAMSESDWSANELPEDDSELGRTIEVGCTVPHQSGKRGRARRHSQMRDLMTPRRPTAPDGQCVNRPSDGEERNTPG